MQSATSPGSPRPLRTITIPVLPLDAGGSLRHARIAYHFDGSLDAWRGNVVLLLHALTGSAAAGTEWWPGLIGPGAALDTTRFAVLTPNLLGSCYGSTGPHETHDAPFPPLTVRDIARSVFLLLERLSVTRVALAAGGSLGGMVALELAASFPGRVAQAVVFAAPAKLGAGAIAWSKVQRQALDLLGPEAGLALAREIAMISYRTPSAFEARFGRTRDACGSFAVQAWLERHGRRLGARFSAHSYRTLIDAMDSHDLGAGPGGVAERLRHSRTAFTGVGIPGDLFCPPEEVRAWVEAARGRYVEIDSPHGHDAFLIEREQVGRILSAALANTPSTAEVA